MLLDVLLAKGGASSPSQVESRVSQSFPMLACLGTLFFCSFLITNILRFSDDVGSIHSSIMKILLLCLWLVVLISNIKIVNQNFNWV